MAKRVPLLRRIAQRKKSKASDTPPANGLRRSLLRKGLLAGGALALAIVMLFAMTAAWYKNVAHSSGLVFQVDEWTIDSSVSITDELIGAAPGDEGTVDVTVDNTSDGIISVMLSVGKGDLYNEIADMRKRLFFYIDDTSYRGGEHTPRVYLNSMEYYTYTVLPQHSLVLGEGGNGAPVMWEWVFDVLGYYFYGTVTTGSTAQISEYLRPVEYVFEQATYVDGMLETVDGTTTPAAFIESLSAHDGYEGVVTTTVTDGSGRVYYPVSVDETGKGVWIYLCTLSEIEYETSVDTRLGTADDAESRRFEAYLHVMAQQKQMNILQVNTAEQLSVALNDNVHDMVQLTGDVVLTDSLTVSGTSEKILDLAGYTLSTEASQIALVKEGASLTVTDGTLTGAGTSSCYGMVVEGGDVVMSDVVITDTAQGVRISDDAARYNDSRITLTGCEIHSTVAGVFIKGNGTQTPAATMLLVEDCFIECDGYYALAGNGTAGPNGNQGTDIVLRNSTLRAVGSAIYHPQRDSSLTVENCVLEAVTPVAIKGGTVVITDSTVTALSGDDYEDEVESPAFSGSGYANTGAGVYVETNYEYPCSVTVGGDTTVTSVYAEAILKFEDTNEKFAITVTGGRYSHDVSAFVAEGYECVKDGDHWIVKEQ